MSRVPHRSRRAQSSRAVRLAGHLRIESLEPRLLLSTYTVMNLNDSGPGSLRDMIGHANTDPGPDTINFASGLSGTIVLTSGQLELSDTSGQTTIAGPGVNVVSISGGSKTRVFQIDANVSAEIDGLTITAGRAPDGAPGADAYVGPGGTFVPATNGTPGENGGGINNLGSLTLSNDTISDCAAGNGGAGGKNTINSGGGGAGGAGGNGGGIYSSGTLTLVDTTVDNNLVGQGGAASTPLGLLGPLGSGGGIWADVVSLTGCNVSGNLAGASGGGIWSNTAMLTNCVVSANVVSSYVVTVPPGGGGGVYSAHVTILNSAFANNLSHSSGGALFTSVFTITGSRFTDNNSQQDGGAVAIDPNHGNGTLATSDFSNNSAGSRYGAISLGTGSYTITDSGFDSNIAVDSGGALGSDNLHVNIKIVGCELTENAAFGGLGGAITLLNTGSLAAIDSIFSGNSVPGAGGAAFYNDTATFTACTFIRNRVTGGGGGGGAIAAGGEAASGISLVLSSCTLSQNFSESDATIDVRGTSAYISNCTVTENHAYVGAGVAGSGNTVVVNSTIMDNWATVDGGGISGSCSLYNTIVAGNTAGGAPSDISGTLDTNLPANQPHSSNNLIGTGGSGGLVNGVNGNIVGVADPKLAPLGNYGGPTMTMPPLPGSPAIDAGSNALAVDANGQPLLTDQRGLPRIYNGTVDIGAVELQPPSVASFVVDDGTAQRSMVRSVTINFTEPVTLGASAIMLTTSSGNLVPFTLTSPDNQSYVLSFGGSLADGRYVLSVHAAAVSDGVGEAMSADQSESFFRLFGDFDGNGTVNNADYLKFKKSYGTSSSDSLYLSLFDYDQNGVINNFDFLQFKKRYGMSV